MAIVDALFLVLHPSFVLQIGCLLKREGFFLFSRKIILGIRKHLCDKFANILQLLKIKHLWGFGVLGFWGL